MNEAIESNYKEYRPWYRPISTGSGVTTTDTEVVAAETEREKGVCLCKQETHMEDSSSTIVNWHPRYLGIGSSADELLSQQQH